MSSPSRQGEPIRVLVVAADGRLAQLATDYLAADGTSVTVASTGSAGVTEALRSAYDCVVLELEVRGPDGLDVCRTLRQHTDVPIIIVIGDGAADGCVLALEAGADDCVAKPVSMRELRARIGAMIRRVRGRAGPTVRTLRVGGLFLDARHLVATIDDRPVEITTLEFAILWALALRAGHVVSREQLLESAKGSAELAFDRSIDVNVCRIRSKLGDDSHSPRLLQTVRGVGYRLADRDPGYSTPNVQPTTKYGSRA